MKTLINNGCSSAGRVTFSDVEILLFIYLIELENGNVRLFGFFSIKRKQQDVKGQRTKQLTTFTA